MEKLTGCIVWLIALVLGMALALGFIVGYLVYSGQIDSVDTSSKVKIVSPQEGSLNNKPVSEEDKMMSIIWSVFGIATMCIIGVGVANYFMAHADHQKLQNRVLRAQLEKGVFEQPMEANYSAHYGQALPHRQASEPLHNGYMNRPNGGYGEPHFNHHAHQPSQPEYVPREQYYSESHRPYPSAHDSQNGYLGWQSIR